MGEYRLHTDMRYWSKRIPVARCKTCSKPVGEMDKAYVCCLSHRQHLYSVYCVDCFAKRTAKKMGGSTEDDGKLIAYEISDIARVMKPLQMKLRVERPGAEILRELDALASHGKEEYYATVEARMIHNFAKSLSLMANGLLSGHGRHSRDPSRYDKHRLELFIKLAKMLRPLLPKITGMMLERLYAKHKPDMMKKYKARSSYMEWLEERGKRPDRLFPLTQTVDDCTELLVRLLPNKSAAIGGENSYYSTDKGTEEAKAKLGLKTDKNVEDHYHSISVKVYNSRKGPRFIIQK